MKINKVDKLFRDGLSAQKIEPSAAAWSKLEGRLRSRRRAAFWSWTAAAAVLLLLLWGGYAIREGRNTAQLLADSEPSMPAINPAIKQDGLPVGPAKEVTNGDKDYVGADLSAKENVPQTADLPGNAPHNRPGAKLSAQMQDSPSRQVADDLAVSEPVRETALGDIETLSATAGTSYPAHTENVPVQVVEVVATAESVAEKVPITIIYKKGNREDITAVAGQKVIKKGIKKLGDITEDMLMSEDAKERWRGRKDDILALNIEKIFKETEYETEQR